MINDRPARLQAQIEQLWTLTDQGHLRWRWDGRGWISWPFNRASRWAERGPALSAGIVPATSRWAPPWTLRVLRDGHEIESCKADDWDLRGTRAVERMERLVALLDARHPGWAGSAHRT